MKACDRRRAAGSMSGWPQEERSSFERLSPIALIPDGVQHRPVEEKRSIIEMMRAKGRLQQRAFALAAAKCAGLFRLLASSLDQHDRAPIAFPLAEYSLESQ